eukprot:gene4474-14633_t
MEISLHDLLLLLVSSQLPAHMRLPQTQDLGPDPREREESGDSPRPRPEAQTQTPERKRREWRYFTRIHLAPSTKLSGGQPPSPPGTGTIAPPHSHAPAPDSPRPRPQREKEESGGTSHEST